MGKLVPDVGGSRQVVNAQWCFAAGLAFPAQFFHNVE
jgi:hypothetical protein